MYKDLTRIKTETLNLQLSLQRYRGDDLSSVQFEELSQLEQQLENSVHKVRARKVYLFMYKHYFWINFYFHFDDDLFCLSPPLFVRDWFNFCPDCNILIELYIKPIKLLYACLRAILISYFSYYFPYPANTIKKLIDFFDGDKKFAILFTKMQFFYLGRS